PCCVRRWCSRPMVTRAWWCAARPTTTCSPPTSADRRGSCQDGGMARIDLGGYFDQLTRRAEGGRRRVAETVRTTTRRTRTRTRTRTGSRRSAPPGGAAVAIEYAPDLGD